MTPNNSQLTAFFDDFLAYHFKFNTNRESKFQKNFQLYLIHRIIAAGNQKLVETYTINIGKHIGIKRYKQLRNGEKEHCYYLIIGNKHMSWEDCPENTMKTIKEKMNNFINFVKYSGCNNLEKLNIEHVMQNINIYCDIAGESNENKMFELLFGIEDKKINDKLLSLIDIMHDKMKEYRVKKLNSFSLMIKLDGNLSEETVKSTRIKL